MKIFDQLERKRAWEPEEQAILDAVRRVADEVIAPKAAGFDKSGEFPWANVEALNGLGLNGLFVPEAYGGSPTRYKLYLAVVKIISEACASTGIIYATNFHGMKPLIDFGSEEQKQRLLPRIAAGGLGSLAITEPNAGSDATGMTTRFKPDGDHIVVDGGKTFITSGSTADLLLVFGKWSEIDDARGAISALIVEKDTPGFHGRSPGRQDGAAGVCHDAAQFRQGPRAARQSAGSAGRRFEDPAGVAQQVAAQHCGARAWASPSPPSRT